MTQRKSKAAPAQSAQTGPGAGEGPLSRPWQFVLALAGFLLVTLIIYFRDFIFHPGWMLYGSDMITQGFQTRKLGVDAVAAGQGIPLWNPFSYCGLPYVGGLPGPMFFPTSILYYIMPLERAIGWSILLMMLSGGLFAYLWVRELGLSRWSGAFAAVAWAFTGWVASTLAGGHDGRQFTILLLPLAMFGLERGLRRRKLVWFLVMGVAVALQILSPHVQMMYYSSLAVAAWFVFRLVNLWREKTPLGALAKLSVFFTAGFIFAVSLSALQFFPEVADQSYSHRQAGTGLGYEGYQHATSFSMHPLETVGLVIPGFTGEPASYWAGADFKGHSEYMGLAVILFALVALVYRRNRVTWFFVGLGLFALLFNFGKFTPFFKLPYYLLPKVKDFRAPNMMFFVCGFSLLTLAAYGLESLIAGVRDKAGGEEGAGAVRLLGLSTIVLALVSVLLAAGRSAFIPVLAGMLPAGLGPMRQPALAQYYPQIVKAAFISTLVAVVLWGAAWAYLRGRINALVLTAILLPLTWGDLMRMDVNWLQALDPGRVYVRDKIVQALQQEKEPYRVFFFPTPNTGDYWDNSLLYFDIPTINASMPIRLAWYEELMGSFQMTNFTKLPQLWHMLNTRFIMMRQGDFAGKLQQYLQGDKVAEDPSTGRVLISNPSAWPRFRLFSRFETLDADEKFIPRFADQNFDWQNTLLLMDKPDFDPSTLDGAAPEGDIKLLSYGNDGLELSVSTTRPALLYLAETWHPSWKATLDGAPVKVCRANLAMRAVYVGAGEHKLVMRYESVPWTWGLRLSLVSIVVLAAVLGWTAYRKDW